MNKIDFSKINFPDCISWASFCVCVFASSLADTSREKYIFFSLSLFFIKGPLWSLGIIIVPFLLLSSPPFEILSVHCIYFKVPKFSSEHLRRTISAHVLANATVY